MTIRAFIDIEFLGRASGGNLQVEPRRSARGSADQV